MWPLPEGSRLAMPLNASEESEASETRAVAAILFRAWPWRSESETVGMFPTSEAAARSAGDSEKQRSTARDAKCRVFFMFFPQKLNLTLACKLRGSKARVDLPKMEVVE